MPFGMGWVFCIRSNSFNDMSKILPVYYIYSWKQLLLNNKNKLLSFHVSLALKRNLNIWSRPVASPLMFIFLVVLRVISNITVNKNYTEPMFSLFMLIF